MHMLQRVKEVWRKLINKNNIEQAAGIDISLSNQMSAAILLWSQLYENKAPWLVNSHTESLNLPAAIASELSRMITLEMKSELTGSQRAEYLREQYLPVLQDLRRYVEYGCAKGGLIFKPYVSEDKITVSYIQGDCFFPTDYDSWGNITGALFLDKKTIGDTYYTKLERQWMEGKVLHILNRAFQSKIQDDIGTEIPLTAVQEWAELPPHAEIHNVDKPMFSYFKVPQANTIDPTSPLGTSVYARAVDLIRQADEQYSRILWEYEAGEMAIDADETLFRRDSNGIMTFPKGKERLFRVLSGLGDDGAKLSAWSPELRDSSLFRGLNELFMRIEDLCGLARGSFSDPSGEAKTATELKILKQRSYATVTDLQMSLQRALEDLVYCMDVLATAYKLAPQGDYELSFAWDDSIIVDAEAERARDLQEIRDGIMQKWEYRVKWFGEDEKTAKSMIPEEKDNDALMGFGGDS